MPRIIYFFLPLMLLLSACQTTKTDPAAQNAVKTYFFSGITTESTSDFTQGFHLDGKENAEALASSFTKETEAKLANIFSQRLVGKHLAKVNVLFREITISSAAGRLAFRSDSTVTGTVTIIDVATNKIIASRTLTAKHAAMKSSGNIGIVIALAVNVANSSRAKRVGKLGDNFAKKVDKWLSKK